VLRVRLSGRPAPVGVPSLKAVELDAPRACARWLSRHRRALGDILEQGTWLDRADVEELLNLPIPGLDELAGLLEIARLVDAGDADTIVVDTAPTGHALRLFAAPETVAALARALDSLHARHRLIRDHLARVGGPEASDRLIARLADDARAIGHRLRDPRQTSIVWVSLAEELAVRETGDALAALSAAGLRVQEIVVNRVVPPGGTCPLCDRRRALERDAIARIRHTAAGQRRVRLIEEEATEPRGTRALAKLGRRLTLPRLGRLTVTMSRAGAQRAQGGRRSPDRRASAAARVESSQGVGPLTLAGFDALADAKLLFVGGKGGVGKTTIAAAAALRLAAVHPHRRVLLISTDPAHSLGDILEVRAGDTPAPVPGAPANLCLRELDATHALALRRAALDRALDELGAAFAADREAGLPGLLDLAPPGVDELVGMLSVFEARHEFDQVVVDTAPTGHALRLLETPEIVREWTQVLMRLLLKYHSVVAPGALGAELVDMSRSIRAFHASLGDARHTRFVVVARAADVTVAETARLLRRLRQLKLAVPAVVANGMTLAPGRCARCRRTASTERRPFAALQRLVHGRSHRCAIIQTPLTAPPPRGIRALEQWSGRWRLATG
jgi:arsenite-transporting ATPase